MCCSDRAGSGTEPGGEAMAEDSHMPPLIRRVPGATKIGPGAVGRPALPSELLKVMQAAVEAARAAKVDEPDASTRAEPRVERTGPNGVAGPQQAGREDAESITEPLPRLQAALASLRQTKA